MHIKKMLRSNVQTFVDSFQRHSAACQRATNLLHHNECTQNFKRICFTPVGPPHALSDSMACLPRQHARTPEWLCLSGSEVRKTQRSPFLQTFSQHRTLAVQKCLTNELSLARVAGQTLHRAPACRMIGHAITRPTSRVRFVASLCLSS